MERIKNNYSEKFLLKLNLIISRMLCLLDNGNIPLFRLFTIFAVSFLGGIFLASFLSVDWDRSWPVFLFILIFSLLTSFFNFVYRSYPLVLLSFSTVFLVTGFGFFVQFDSSHSYRLPFDQSVIVSGKIASKPEVLTDKQKVRVKILEIDGQPFEKNVNILIQAPHFPELSYGQKIEVKGEIKEPGEFNGFDYKAYLKRYLTYGVIYYPSDFQVNKDKKNWQERFISSLYQISREFEKSINHSIQEPHASLASGLILGIKRNIPDKLMGQLNTTGLTHIIALSGYNVTIIISILTAFLVSSLGRKKTFWSGILLISAFVILTGAMPSVVRASLFSGLILFGKTIGKKADQTNVLIFTALVMVLFNPYVLKFDLGFQLSFLAFCGIIYIAPVLTSFVEKNKLRRLPKIIKLPLIETLSAQFAVAPLIFFQFDRLSVISPLANLAVLWIIPASMLLSFITGLFGIIHPLLGNFFGYLLWPTLEYVIKIVELLSKVPFAEVIQ